MTKSQETLEQFEKLAGGEGIAEIIKGAFDEGFSIAIGHPDRWNTLPSYGEWGGSDTKALLDNLLTKLKEKSDE